MKWRKETTAGMMRPIVAKIMKTITSSRDKFAIIDFLDLPNAKLEQRRLKCKYSRSVKERTTNDCPPKPHGIGRLLNLRIKCHSHLSSTSRILSRKIFGINSFTAL